MPLLDDLLRLFGTNRVRLRWRWQSFRDRRKRRGAPGRPRPVATAWLLPADFPLVTAGLVAVCLGIFFMTVKVTHDLYPDAGQSFKPAGPVLWRYGAEDGLRILHLGEWWRLVTAMFLHGGVTHILFNSIGLWTAGQTIEEDFGRPRTLVIYLVSGLGGALGSLAWHGEGTASVGASGAVFGLMGCALGHALRWRGRAAQHVKDRFVPWILYGLIFSFMPGIDGAAHVGGLITGGVLGALLSDRQQARRAPEWLWRIAAAACLAGVVVAFWMMYTHPLAGW